MANLREFQNPIVPGFAPDPSVVFVGDTAFLVNSSFHIFPGLPIYASKDLNKWTHIGNAINRKHQISYENCGVHGLLIENGVPLFAAGGLFAPTIRWKNGIFYIICTNFHNDGKTENFFVSSKNIWANEWSDPVYFDFQGIDTSFFFDDDGRSFVQGSWREGSLSERLCSIRQFEIDLETGKPLSEAKNIWDGSHKGDIEGPHLYKKDGYYYLMVADGGTFEHHFIAIARSKNIWGPYETFENNPIVTADGTNEPIQNTGHGDLFQDQDGSWWITLLGVRNEDGRYPLGRETFLAPVTWPPGGWPKVEQPKMRFQRGQVTHRPSETDNLISQKRPRVEDIYIKDANLEDYKFSEDGHSITIVARNTDLSAPLATASFLGRRQRSLNCAAKVTLQLEQQINSELRAGLTVYKDNFRHADIYHDFKKSAVVFSVQNKLKGDPVIIERQMTRANSLSFKIEATPKSYEFLYRTEVDSIWTSLYLMDTMEMTALDFTGTIFGIFAAVEKPHEGSPVTFMDFEIL